MGNKNSTSRKDKRRADAAERAEVQSARTPKEQLQRLDQLLGKGIGAQKERTKLQKAIEAEKAASKEAAEKPKAKKAPKKGEGTNK